MRDGTRRNRISKELSNARKKLLDLTLRNKLLNFKRGTKSAIHIVEEVPREAYGRLVLEEKTMAFKPRPDKRGPRELESTGEMEEEPETSRPGEESEAEDARDLWRLDDSQLAGQHQDQYLQTDLTKEELAKRLIGIRRKAQEFMEEQGYSVLYLALGFLEWRERDDTEPCLAPLVLVPVELKRLRAERRYNLKWTGEDIFTNLSLQKKLKEQGVELPEFEMPDLRRSTESASTYNA